MELVEVCGLSSQQLTLSECDQLGEIVMELLYILASILQLRLHAMKLPGETYAIDQPTDGVGLIT